MGKSFYKKRFVFFIHQKLTRQADFQLDSKFSIHSTSIGHYSGMHSKQGALQENSFDRLNKKRIRGSTFGSNDLNGGKDYDVLEEFQPSLIFKSS